MMYLTFKEFHQLTWQEKFGYVVAAPFEALIDMIQKRSWYQATATFIAVVFGDLILAGVGLIALLLLGAGIVASFKFFLGILLG